VTGLADKDRKRKVLNSGVSNNYNYYAGSGGALTERAGYGKSAERYRDRVRGGGSQSFPNRRRRIITGKDLTTPLRKARVTERHKRVRFATDVVSVSKEDLPWSFIFKIIAVGAALCILILTYIVLFEADNGINLTANKIRAAHIETNVLERQFELENDSPEILRMAREDYGMVEERYIQKKFISSRSADRAVIAERNGFLPDIAAAFLARLRRDD
jgi:hypothetical protein